MLDRCVVKLANNVKLVLVGPYYLGLEGDPKTRYYFSLRIGRDGGKLEELLDVTVDHELGDPFICLYTMNDLSPLLDGGLGTDVSEETLSMSTIYLYEPLIFSAKLGDYSFTKETLDGCSYIILECKGKPICILGPDGLTTNKELRLDRW